MVPDELVASVEETVVTDDFIPVITKKSAMSISKDNGNISDSGTKSKTENFLTNFVSNKKGRRSQKNKLNRGNHETKKDLMVTGAGAVSSDFMGAPRRAWMYVGRVNVNVKESQIENHLKGKFPGEDFSVERLTKRDAAHSASFKIGASLSLVEDLYKPQNWPTGVSLGNKLELIEKVLNTDNYKVACITEHWMNTSQINALNILNFEVASAFARSTFIHGGCVILVRSDCQFEPVESINDLSVEKHIEMCATFEKSTKTYYFCVYRSPQGNFEIFADRLDEALNIIASTPFESKVLIAGDFNIIFNEINSETRKVKEILNSYGMHVIFDQASRVTQTSRNCIDNVFTNLNRSSYKTATVNYHLSDHLAQRLDIQQANIPVKQRYKMVRIMNEKNTNLFREQLRNIDWSSLRVSSAQTSFRDFHRIVIHSFNQCFPERKKKIVNPLKKKCWENPEMVNIKNKLDAAHTIYEVKRDECSKKLYMGLKHQFRQLLDVHIRNENSRYLNEAENKNRAVWQIMNSTIKSNAGKVYPPTLSEETFNRYFSTIAEKLTGKNTNPESSERLLKNRKVESSRSFFLSPTTPEEVKKVILEMKNKGSQDVYGFSVKLLREVVDCLVVPISDLMNDCFQRGYFPDELKIARVIPVHKAGSRENYENYRPISILPVMSKIFETLLKTRLVSFLEKNSLLSISQYGFREGRSTISALVHLVEFIIKALDDGDEVMLTCMDLSKAFDCVNHDMLLRKLEYIGVRGPALDLLRSYLRDRCQVVDVDGKRSSKVKIAAGVPQGSVLGPILFLIFIDDLTSNVAADDETIFADDTSFLNRAKDRNLLLNKSHGTIKSAIEWFHSNDMKVNEEKTQEMVVSTKLHETKTILLLGVSISANLTWMKQANELCSKLSSALFAIRRIKNILTEKEALLTYHTHFHSRMIYGIILWGASPEANRVFLKQKQALRLMAGVSQISSCRPLFRKYGVLTLSSCYILECLLYVHKNRDTFQRHSAVHDHNTRFGGNLITPRHRLTKTQNTHIFNGTRFYNRLPQRLTSLHDITFKRQVKAILIEGAFYSMEEFMSYQF
ncbi:uncharacterized protein LOC123678705 [Harmonia axyridis]|uniref:uncharacterized protein LOC123678705 n=1 Tax=Harmonia axyridis TaxID=115357 RepID=UPI001E2755F3|nr:uncharacterized protein LOC123678705 [Harmonia axyridis]